ncbi:hypothetical protein DM50_4045 [Burkholderia mallei]|nr:hypothetical protein DM46_2773 [Burkholderia mallei]KOT02443.1 hypothetical protein DM50_4045 [Burkholderia mallei]KOT22792.1 hypothetical protein DM52_2745 [Burkholderia mallei]
MRVHGAAPRTHERLRTMCGASAPTRDNEHPISAISGAARAGTHYHELNSDPNRIHLRRAVA